MQENLEIRRRKYKQQLGLIIKELRKQKKKSISLISAEIGMTKSMWADLEKGIKDPQFSTVLRIAEALNFPASEISKELEKRLGEDFSLIE
ncbi:MAG: helix-turn-helix domain-containing protein [Candidatus Gastranaerophilaceae bacterium]